MRYHRFAASIFSMAGVVLAQGTLPNPYFKGTMAPWVGDSGVVWAPNNFASDSVAIPAGAKLKVSTSPPFNQFFGQGVNVIFLTASGFRDTAPHNVTFKIDGQFFLNKSGSSFSRNCEIPTATKHPNPKANPYGIRQAFAWAVPVTPGGNGSGTFTIEATDSVGIVTKAAESFFLLQKNNVPPGAAAGYLLTSIAPGGTWNVNQVTNELNDMGPMAPGHSPQGILNVGAFAPAGFSKITFQAKAQQAGSKIQVHVWDWGTGCGQGAWVALPETAGNTQFGAGTMIGTSFGASTSFTVANPARFVEPSTGVVVVRMNLAPRPILINTTPPPNALSIRAFRLQ